MELISLNIGVPQEVLFDNHAIITSINKTPVYDRRKVSFLNIDGDRQSDLKNHGGFDKAVYAYSIEYYEEWKKHITRETWEYGLFGENLTTRGLLDNDVKIGNIYKIGTASIQAIQPRFPCYKLNYKFNNPKMADLFKELKMNGIYFRVLEEGEIQAGDEIILSQESEYNVTIFDLVKSHDQKGKDRNTLSEILKIPYLPESLKKEFMRFLNN